MRSWSGGRGNVCQQSIRWAMEQKLQLFSQSRGWLSWLLLGDSGVLAAYSLDMTYSTGSVCGRWGLSGGRDNTQCPARSLGRQRKYGSPQISFTVTWLWRLLLLASWLALSSKLRRVTMAVIEDRCSAGRGRKDAYWFFLFYIWCPNRGAPQALLLSKY